MSINGLSFASAKPAPQPCVSVHQCKVFENVFFITCRSFPKILAPSSPIMLYPRSRPTTNMLPFNVLYSTLTSWWQESELIRQQKLSIKSYKSYSNSLGLRSVLWRRRKKLWPRRSSLRSKRFRAYEEHTKTFSIFDRARPNSRAVKNWKSLPMLLVCVETLATQAKEEEEL